MHLPGCPGCLKYYNYRGKITCPWAARHQVYLSALAFICNGTEQDILRMLAVTMTNMSPPLSFIGLPTLRASQLGTTGSVAHLYVIPKSKSLEQNTEAFMRDEDYVFSQCLQRLHDAPAGLVPVYISWSFLVYFNLCHY